MNYLLKITIIFFIIFFLFKFSSAQLLKNTEQNVKLVADSSKIQQLWNPLSPGIWTKYNQKFLMNEPKISLKAPIKKYQTPYYDLGNVFPKNPLFLDYRHHSYYTPKMVSDFITHTMNRPPADSFVPLPTIALLAASVALQYVEIGRKIKITAHNFLVDEQYHPILLALWNQSPQTAADIYRTVQHKTETTAGRVRKTLQYLVEQRLVKIKQVENEAPRYYPALSRKEAMLLFKNAHLNEALTADQLKVIRTLYKKMDYPEAH